MARSTEIWLLDVFDPPPGRWVRGTLAAWSTAALVAVVALLNLIGAPLAEEVLLVGVLLLSIAVAMLAVRQNRVARFTHALMRALESSGEGVTVATEDASRLLWVNEEVARIRGVPREELIGASTSTLIDPADRHLVAHRARVRGAGRPVAPTLVTRARRPDGSDVEVEVMTMPVAAGGRRVLVSLIRDLTSRRAIEASARADHALASTVLATVDSAVAVAARDGVLVHVNPALERLVGRPASELTGRRWDELRVVPDASATREQIRAALAGHPASFIAEIAAGAGTRLVQWNLKAVAVGGDAEPTHVVAAGTDVTDTRRAEERLSQALARADAAADELRRADAELEHFASVASHDLREPLRAITGFLELLRREHEPHLDERGRTFLTMIDAAAKRMDELLTAVTRYGRAGLARTEPRPVRISDAVAHVMAALAAEIGERGAQVEVEADARVGADPDGVEQVLRQLVANAITFNESDLPRVAISADDRGAEWELVIRDNGIGIPERERERVFQMFRRLHPRGAYPGTGAGLAIAQRIVQRQGGRMWVDAAPDGGSEFHVVLPNLEGAR